MIKTIISAAVAALTLTSAALAQPYPTRSGLPSLDGKSIAERMVICDTALFLNSRPNFQANRMFTVRRAGPAGRELLLPPYFIGPDRWYDEDLDIAADRLRARGQVTTDELRAAFDQYAEPVLDGYVNRSRAMTIPRVALSRQAAQCSRFARDLRLNRVS